MGTASHSSSMMTASMDGVDGDSSRAASSPALFHPSPSDSDSEEELRNLTHGPWNSNKRLSKQLSMCETPRDLAWEKRRRQMLRQMRRRHGMNDSDEITDEDLRELKGCIELGFGFSEEEGQKLCVTLPALDMYFAVNRQLSPNPVATPHSVCDSPSTSLDGRSSSFGSDSDWKVCNPGDNPQQVKTKLRQWAQIVACSVMQSHNH